MLWCKQCSILMFSYFKMMMPTYTELNNFKGGAEFKAVFHLLHPSKNWRLYFLKNDPASHYTPLRTAWRFEAVLQAKRGSASCILILTLILFDECA